MKNYRIPQLADKYTNFDMIRTYTELPLLADPRLMLLQTVLEDCDVEENELYTLATALVQLGMDTHDGISPQYAKQRREQDMRSTQLKVLAGDYFSARFYHLLARQGKVTLIAKLSEAVCEINQLKMDMYFNSQRQLLTAEQYIVSTAQVKSQLFLQFSNLLSGDLATLWPHIIIKLSELEIIVDQIVQLNDKQDLSDSLVYYYLLEKLDRSERRILLEQSTSKQMDEWIDRYHINQWLDQLLSNACFYLNRASREVASAKVSKQLIELTEQLCSQTKGVGLAVQK